MGESGGWWGVSGGRRHGGGMGGGEGEGGGHATGKRGGVLGTAAVVTEEGRASDRVSD